jgi:hypothetical protein
MYYDKFLLHYSIISFITRLEEKVRYQQESKCIGMEGEKQDCKGAIWGFA